MTDEDKIQLGTVEVPEHLRPHYANFVNVNHTPWDFRLVFALVRAPQPGQEAESAASVGAIHPQAVADLMIPANLMHGLISALRTNFEQYLTQYGAPGMDPEGPRPPEEEQ